MTIAETRRQGLVNQAMPAQPNLRTSGVWYQDDPRAVVVVITPMSARAASINPSTTHRRCRLDVAARLAGFEDRIADTTAVSASPCPNHGTAQIAHLFRGVSAESGHDDPTDPLRLGVLEP